MQIADRPAPDLEREAAVVAAAEALERAQSEHVRRLDFLIRHNTGLVRRIQSAYDDYSEHEVRYQELRQVAFAANGKLPGVERKTFETYVQAYYFAQVVALANQRLEQMSGGRFRLIHRREALDLRSRSGLELDVFDYYTGKQRPASTLSGGETFMASLSLALGMSDVMQSSAGGFDIDTLFVDEGFGSLDADALDQAVAILEDLGTGSRLIAIISHVASLRERIPNQILLQSGPGGSILSIMPSV